MKLSVETRKSRNGRWWCNCTYNGYDYYSEGATIKQARLLLIGQLKRFNLSKDDIFFEMVKKRSQEQNENVRHISYAKNRVDNL